jgi:tetratricopeptide (TPR) repeat protein/tRNA A-37 threonylcarbamoyl transferase component Bud32
MSTDRSPQAMRIFEQVADLPPAQRAAKLGELCAGDAGLRALVEAMLAADARADEPFSGNAAQWSDALGSEATVEPPTAQGGRTIGPWRITGEIGRGGMGAVYAVQRDDGAYTQRAALKLIRRAADSPAARERFLRERQLLAQLQHPHIATLLDGGFSADGDPYFVMEYVDGQPIDAWCDARRLGLRERIELFGQVLDAVSHAHRNLVVHRDLKPANLLVDAQGQVKLLDFGIAKQLEGADATATSDRALTFEYASPEQLHAGPITTATDLWQLGIVLHRLLSGAHPFGLGRDTPLPKQLQLLESEPEPLTRAAAQADAETAALRNGLSPAALARELRGPLSNVVQGCLRRDPAQRYASADALADDLQRWLQHRPLRIEAPSRTTAARLWLRRNRGPAAAAAAVLLAVMAGSAVALWQAREARTQAAIAEQQRNQAQQQSLAARASLQFLTDTLAAAAPENALDTEVSVRQLLDHARATLDQRGTVDPQVKQPVQRLLGELYHSLGDLKTAAALFAAGFEGVEPRSRDEAESLAAQMATYSGVLHGQERGEESLAAAERAADWYRRYDEGDPAAQVKALVVLGSGHSAQADYPAAETHWQDAIALAKPLATPPREDVIEAYQLLGGLLNLTGEYARALQVLDEGLAFADAQGVPPGSLLRVSLLRNRGEALGHNGDFAAAERTIREAIALQEQAVGSRGTTTSLLYGALGSALSNLGRYRESLAALEHADALAAEARGTPLDAAINLSNLGSVYESAGDYPKAVELFERSLVRLEEAGDSGEAAAMRWGLERNYARGLGQAGRYAEAGAIFDRLRARALADEGADSFGYAFIVWQQVVLAKRMGDAAHGLQLLEEARARLGKLAPEAHPVFAHALRAEAEFSRVRGDLAAAESAQREALARLSGGTDAAIARAELAGILAAGGKRDEAKALLQQALPVLREAVLPQELHRAAAEKLATQLGV